MSNDTDRWQPEVYEADGSGHEGWRTIPTDGPWCRLCGLSYARWSGDDCSGDGVLGVLEGKIVELRAQLAAAEGLAEKWNATPDYTVSEYDRGRVDQRHDMTTELLEVLA